MAGQTNVLNYTIWQTPLDTIDVVTVPSPTIGEVVVTNPEIPGLELHIPANSVIRDAYGRVVTHIGITPIPMNQPPFPLKKGVVFPVYFTIQPGGASFSTTGTAWSGTGDAPKGARIHYQNYPNAASGTVFSFWNYDPAQKGWYVYGRGRVTGDRKMIVPDNGTQIWSFDGAMVSSPGGAPGDGPAPPPDPCSDFDEPCGSFTIPGPSPGSGSTGMVPAQFGQAVDMQTGLFVYTKTDLALPDIISLILTRKYRQNDFISRAFGIGTSMSFDMFMVGDDIGTSEGYTYQDLILADGGRVHFTRTLPCTGANGYCDYTNAAYAATSSPGGFYGATLAWAPGFGPVSETSWVLTKKDGTSYYFRDSSSQSPRAAALLGMQDRYGNVLTFTRDSNYNLIKIASPNSHWIQFTYDASNRVTQAQDNIGRTVSYTYDSGGRLATATDADGGVTSYTYDANNDMLTITDPRHNVSLSNQYDSNSRISKQTLADNSTYQYNYTTGAMGNVVQTDMTDPRGYVRRMAFNSDGYLVGDTQALGAPEQQTITYERQQGSDLILSVTDALNRKTAYTYDAMGDVTSVTSLAGTPNAVTTQYGYTHIPTGGLWLGTSGGTTNVPVMTPIMAVSTMTDPLGHTTSLSYDKNGDLASITDALGNTFSGAFNAVGQLVTLTDPLGNAVHYAYDSGDLTGITDPLGRTTKLFVDAAGRVASVTDPLGSITKYAHDALNQVIGVTDPAGSQTAFTYDGNGNLLTVTDANQHTTTYTYDKMDRLQTRQDPLQNTEGYQYDASGNLAQFTDRRGKIATYAYDGLSRRYFAGFGMQTGPSYESTIGYTYDAGNRLTQLADSIGGTIERGYDGLDRLTSEATPQGTVNYTHDAAGRRQTMTVASQPVVGYSYDGDNRVTLITQAAATVGFTYDSDGRRTSLTLPNGVVVNYSYDAASQLSGIGYQTGAATLGNLAYAYDLAGRRTGLTGSFARMSLPNPVSAAAYNANNQLTQWGTTALAYDANGNLVNDGLRAYTWDARNQLAAMGAMTFQYDGIGRRIQNGAGTNYLYDGVNAVQELSSGSVTANLLSGGVDENFLRTDASGSWSFLADGLGSTLGLADTTGTIQTQYTYDPFGQTSISGSGSGNPSQYTGRENDGTGLYYYRARYYDPALGRFISEDPLGFSAGMNVYSYVGNDPVNVLDPWGLQGKSANNQMTTEQHQCTNSLIITAVVHGVGSALGVGIPGSDPAGDIAGMVKDAAKSPAIRAGAGVMAAQLGSALLTRAGAVRLAAFISEDLVPGIGWAAGAYIAYSAISDGVQYYRENIGSCVPLS